MVFVRGRKHMTIMRFRLACLWLNTGSSLQLPAARVVWGVQEVLTGDPLGPGGPLGPIGP